MGASKNHARGEDRGCANANLNSESRLRWTFGMNTNDRQVSKYPTAACYFCSFRLREMQEITAPEIAQGRDLTSEQFRIFADH